MFAYFGYQWAWSGGELNIIENRSDRIAELRSALGLVVVGRKHGRLSELLGPPQGSLGIRSLGDAIA